MAFANTQREKNLLILTVLAVVFGGGYFLVFSPIRQHYQALDQEIQELMESWEDNKQLFIQSKQYRAEYERISDSLSLDGDQSQKKEIINQELTRLLEETGIVATHRTDNNPLAVDDDYLMYSFSLRGIQTNWPTLARFLYRIETNPAILEVNKITVQRMTGSRTNEDQTLNVDIEVSRLIEHQLQRRRERRR